MGETPVIHQRFNSVRISSPQSLFLAVFTGGTPYFFGHFPTLLWHFILPYPLHTHVSCLALSFPLRHLTIAATMTVSHSHSLWSHILSIFTPSSLPVLHLTPQYLTLSTTFYPPSRSICGLAKCVCPFVRDNCELLKFVNEPATLTRPMPVICTSTAAHYLLCSATPKHPTLLWAHVWVCGC